MAGVAASVRGCQVGGVEGVATLGEADDVVDGAGHPMQRIVAGEVVVDGQAAEAAGCVVGCAVCHALGLGASPAGAASS